MNRFALCALASALVASPFAAKADTIINLNATVNNGTSIGGTTNTLAPSFYSTQNLAAGSYTVTLVGTSTAGAVYNGWSQSIGSNGLAAPGSFQDRTGFSTGGTTFSTAGGNDTYSPYPNTTDLQLFKNGTGSCSVAGNCYDTAAAANAAFNGSTYSFTLLAPTAVTFYIPDQSYPTYPGFTDNTGGVSLSLKAVTPEPSSLVLLATGTLTAAGAMRRRFIKA